jgi:hypothetical protein
VFVVLVAALVVLSACHRPGSLPSLSLRALGVLHQRRSDSVPTHAFDWALTAQLAFEPNPKQLRRLVYVPDPIVVQEAIACAEPLLCAWANATEQSTLAGLGVPP